MVTSKSNTSKFFEVMDTLERLNNAFESPEGVIESELDIPSEPKKTRAPRGSAFKQNLCPEHVNYKAERAPRTDCSGCWTAYKRMNPTKHTLAKANFDRKHTKK